MLPKVANDNSKAERWVEAERVVKRWQKKVGPNSGGLMLPVSQSLGSLNG